MNVRSTSLHLIAQIFFIILTTLFFGYLLFTTEFYPLAGLIALIILLQVFALIRIFNRTNEKITYFFDAIRDEDSTLRFPVDIQNETELNLNKRLNKVNELIQTAKTKQIAQEKYYAHILEQATTGLITFTTDGHIRLANSAAKRLLGFEHLRHINQLSKTNKKLHSALQSFQQGEAFGKLIKYTTEKETIQLSLKSSPITVQDQQLILVAINNIRSELEEHEIDSWIRLIRVLTHEIMNSIAPITSIAGTLSESFKDNSATGKASFDQFARDKAINGLHIIEQRGKGLIAFVDSYRKLSRIPKPQKKEFELGPLFEEIRILVSQEPNFDRAKIAIDVPSGFSISADRGQLTQVLINLVKNSLDAIKEHEPGLITLAAEHNSDGKALLSITDNGAGIPQEVVDQIFIPFFTTKEKGTGIGLSLSHHILRLHGGRIQVSSMADKGTTFEIHLE